MLNCKLKITNIVKSSEWGLEKSKLPWEQKIYCDVHSLLSSTTAVQIWIISYVLHIISLLTGDMNSTDWKAVGKKVPLVSCSEVFLTGLLFIFEKI